MIREVLEKMPKNVRTELENIRKARKNGCMTDNEARQRAAGYTQGLYDGGLITERERQKLFIYTTV